MAKNQEGSPEPPRPPAAAIPDLKKAQENKPAPFAWAPGAARSAASAAVIAAPAKTPTALDRLNTTPGRLAVLAVLMLLGGAGFSLTAYLDRAGGGGAGELGGIRSTIKSRAFQGRDSVGFNKGYGAGNDPTARKSGMNFDLIKAGEKAMNVEIPEMPDVPGAGGETPVNHDKGATGRAGAAGGAATARGEDGAGNEDGGGLAGGPAPKLGSSYGKINFQGMRRVSGTAGFRGIKATAPNQTIKTRGSAANSSGASGRGGTGSTKSPLTPFSRDDPRAAGALSGRTDGAGAGAAAGGGGGGGGVDVGNLEKTVDQNLPSIPDLLAQAASKRKEADKEEKKAKHLASGGHFAQAHYHYDRAEKKKDEAKDLENQANQQINAIKDEAGSLTEEPGRLTEQEPP
ncbi:MAG: hypothetical protein Q8T11_03940 [Elusimicrobiota bacterium]|nr:hypothetical protein [Elusimicrobiota bacterium]